MKRSYWKVQDDIESPGRWFLRAPADLAHSDFDPRGLITGSKMEERAFTAAVRSPGAPLDFTFADFGVPIVSKRVGDLLERLAPSDIQLMPVYIEGHRGDFYVLNVIARACCVDEQRSRVSRWTERDGRPDKVGTYRMVGNLVVRPDAVGEHKIFRVAGWEVALVVDDSCRAGVHELAATGIHFKAAS